MKFLQISIIRFTNEVAFFTLENRESKVIEESTSGVRYTGNVYYINYWIVFIMFLDYIQQKNKELLLNVLVIVDLYIITI